MEPGPLDRLWMRGGPRAGPGVARLRAKRWQIAQCAVAAGAAWLIASDLLHHQTPFFAPVAAVVSLGTSYGQRLRRVAEVTIGVAIGVFVGDLIVAQVGTGWWQLTLIVALAMTTAVLLDGGQLFVNQAAIQSIVVEHAAARQRRGPAALDRRARGRCGGPRGGDGGAGRAAAPSARAGGGRDAQDGRVLRAAGR